MKTFLRFVFKSFASIVGISLGVMFAMLFLATLVLSLGSGSMDYRKPAFESVANAEGEYRDLGKDAPIIAIIDCQDVISPNKGSAASLSNCLETMVKNSQLRKRVKGVIVHMNCPGGSVFEVFKMYSALRTWKARTHCPVYVFVDGMCASGGYYISCAADRIYTTPVSLVGSIGVLSGPYFNVKECLNRYGIQTDLLTMGENKAPLNPYTPWTDAAKKEYQHILAATYDQFVSVVISSRPAINRDVLVQEIGASVLPAKEALEVGLIDHTDATRDDVIRDMATACGIGDEYRVIRFSQQVGWKKFVDGLSNYIIDGMKQALLTHDMEAIAIDF